ncbi:hypothetical protein [Chryseobacterium viscerum]|uniref:Outer membrane protein beta-barrel domain-containing protein n=1 Tax=Chryseobacterium viscerum TaxID=1037377 RepID=A0A316WRD8_9FLAO|nr:hypothetical protein [Chryseobacterium viscerum]PWN61130.1 hypothetical protein C1634_013800 [Chryseobacterium viscerum]
MKTKLILMGAVMAFSYGLAQESPENNLSIYSKKIDSIVMTEKGKMSIELDQIDKSFKAKKITSDEKQKQRTIVASKYEQIINEKIDSQKQDLETATKELVKDAVFKSDDTLKNGRNQLWLGLNGFNMKLNEKKKRNNPKNYLQTFELSVSMGGAGLTSKNEPFGFYNKNSDIKNSVINSWQLTLWYGNQIGSYTSPFFYRFGLGVRSDQLTPKYGQAFKQDKYNIFVDDFDRGNLKKSILYNTYITVPVDLKFVLNPKYKEYEGVKYLDNNQNQLSLILGVYGGVKVGSINYSKYSNEFSDRIVEREKVMHGVNDFVFGGKIGISYAGFNLFVQKDFTPAFNDNALLKKKYGLQIGIEIANVNF